jgi:lipid A 3-O-deacylase
MKNNKYTLLMNLDGRRSASRNLLRCHVKVGAVALLALSASFSARAEDDDSSKWGLQLAAGIADHHQIHVRKADIGLVWDPRLSWWDIGGWHFSMVVEGHLAAWHTDQGNVNSNIVETGVTPVFRFGKNSGSVRPFIEAGVGVRLISHPRISTDYTLSSAFQFADMVGVGLQLGERQQYQTGFRFQHLSNAGIKHPNPGINFYQAYVQYNF